MWNKVTYKKKIYCTRRVFCLSHHIVLYIFYWYTNDKAFLNSENNEWNKDKIVNNNLTQDDPLTNHSDGDGRWGVVGVASVIISLDHKGILSSGCEAFHDGPCWVTTMDIQEL